MAWGIQAGLGVTAALAFGARTVQGLSEQGLLWCRWPLLGASGSGVFMGPAVCGGGEGPWTCDESWERWQRAAGSLAMFGFCTSHAFRRFVTVAEIFLPSSSVLLGRQTAVSSSGP